MGKDKRICDKNALNSYDQSIERISNIPLKMAGSFFAKTYISNVLKDPSKTILITWFHMDQSIF